MIRRKRICSIIAQQFLHEEPVLRQKNEENP
jgi:hypothetical protein